MRGNYKRVHMQVYFSAKSSEVYHSSSSIIDDPFEILGPGSMDTRKGNLSVVNLGKNKSRISSVGTDDFRQVSSSKRSDRTRDDFFVDSDLLRNKSNSAVGDKTSFRSSRSPWLPKLTDASQPSERMRPGPCSYAIHGFDSEVHLRIPRSNFHNKARQGFRYWLNNKTSTQRESSLFQEPTKTST